ncbi:MAG: hypothetical protein ABIP39_06505 [Polyangiaceae bacterium]
MKKPSAGIPLGERGQIVVSTAQTVPVVGYSHGQSGGSLIYGDDLDEPVYAAPRLVLDYVAARRFTIGTDVLASFTLGAAPKRGERLSVTLIGVAPHIGYILAPNPLVAFWPRAGITYYALTEEDAALSSTHRQLSLSVSASLVITPFPHLGVTMGPAMDLPITGKLVTRDAVTGGSAESSASLFHVGFSAGLLVYF